MSDRTPQTIVITGGTGLIGGAITRRLVERGDRVIAFSRNPEQARRKLPESVEHVQWSATTETPGWREHIDGADAVINLAGAPIAKRWTKKHKELIYTTRVVGTQRLVEAIAQAKQPPKTLISASAVGYYGSLRPEPVAEDASAGDDYLAVLCVDWENAAMKAEAYGVRVARIRTGIVLDPNGDALSRLVLAFKLFAGGPIASGRQWFPWIHIEDEVGIYLWALDNANVSGPLNAASPGIVINREFSRILGKTLHRPSWLPVPTFGLKLLFGEGAAVVTSNQHQIPARTLELGYSFRFTDLTLALKNLLKH